MKDIGYCFAIIRLLYESLHGLQKRSYGSLSSLYSNLYKIADFDKLLLDPEMTDNDTIRIMDNLVQLTSKGSVRSSKIISMLQRAADLVPESTLLSLPYALAFAFNSEFWKRAHYIPDHDTYTGNVHLIILALAKMLPCFDTLNASGENVSSTKLAEQFIAASTLAILKTDFESNKTAHPNNTCVLLSLLEKFVEWSDETVIDRASLEKYIPYALLHHGQMEMKKDSFLHGEPRMPENPFGSE